MSHIEGAFSRTPSARYELSSLMFDAAGNARRTYRGGEITTLRSGTPNGLVTRSVPVCSIWGSSVLRHGVASAMMIHTS